MPQQLYWVREKESGQAFQMHSVDAAEGPCARGLRPHQ